jgi:hypothetical protein
MDGSLLPGLVREYEYASLSMRWVAFILHDNKDFAYRARVERPGQGMSFLSPAVLAAALEKKTDLF